MAATTVTDTGNVRIITEVIPATDPRAAQLASGSQAPARTSLQTQGFWRAHPRVLGTIHIFNGIVHICFRIILTLSEHSNPSLPVASGILFWLGILLLVSGSLLAESERRDSPVLVKTCCVVNVGIVLGTLVATGIHGTAISRVLPACEKPEPFQTRPEWCLSMESKMLRHGLDSTLVLLILLEFCVAVAVLAVGYDAADIHPAGEGGGDPRGSLEIPAMLMHPFLPPKGRPDPGVPVSPAEISLDFPVFAFPGAVAAAKPRTCCRIPGGGPATGAPCDALSVFGPQ
ncbi:membrane-spanning 4-domains subfamily A member 4A-like [Taeniopygia guttata]|uniref:membrane-spanning 4-domains subfamily A member 4A-like n=1 Tax=Taeniopygia guttata TaxID=59729 RepID=UPI003BB8D38D